MSGLKTSGRQLGFTLIEMIVVIAITAIIGGMSLVFMKWPVQQYMDVSRRSELAYLAESASFRLTTEIGSAVPGSIRISGCGATPCIEFLQAMQSGGDRTLPALSEKSPDQRFVEDGAQQAVSYVCTGRLGALNADGDGQARLERHRIYGSNPALREPTAGDRALLADKVSDCSFEAAGARLVGVRLTLTAGGEPVSLYLEIPTWRER